MINNRKDFPSSRKRARISVKFRPINGSKKPTPLLNLDSRSRKLLLRVLWHRRTTLFLSAENETLVSEAQPTNQIPTIKHTNPTFKCLTRTLSLNSRRTHRPIVLGWLELTKMHRVLLVEILMADQSWWERPTIIWLRHSNNSNSSSNISGNSQQRPPGSTGRGRGRGVNNLPAWLIAQKRKEQELGGGGGS